MWFLNQFCWVLGPLNRIKMGQVKKKSHFFKNIMKNGEKGLPELLKKGKTPVGNIAPIYF